MYTKLILVIIPILTKCSNYHTPHWFLSGKPLICYLHNLSSMKVSQWNNDYFDVTLQTKDKHLRGICFSPDKMKPLKSRFKSLSPVKLNSYAVKRNIHRWRQNSHEQKNKDVWSETHKGLKRVTRVQCSWIFTFTIFGNLSDTYPFSTNGCRTITMQMF